MSKFSPEFIDALSDLSRWWEAAGITGYVIGGVAVSAYGDPRVTKDVDATVLLNSLDLNEFVRLGRDYGFEPRVDDVPAFAEANRILLLRHVGSGMPVDIALGVMRFEYEMAERSIPNELPNGSIRVASPEDLLILKCFAGRARDSIDVASILETQPGLDLGYVRERLRGLSELMDEPEIAERLDRFAGPGKNA